MISHPVYGLNALFIQKFPIYPTKITNPVSARSTHHPNLPLCSTHSMTNSLTPTHDPPCLCFAHQEWGKQSGGKKRAHQPFVSEKRQDWGRLPPSLILPPSRKACNPLARGGVLPQVREGDNCQDVGGDQEGRRAHAAANDDAKVMGGIRWR